MASNWNPQTHPYRVRKIRAGGPHGWSDSVRTYATLEEAMVSIKAKMAGGEYESQLDFANLNEEGKHDKWIRLATRKINKPVVETKAMAAVKAAGQVFTR